MDLLNRHPTEVLLLSIYSWYYNHVAIAELLFILILYFGNSPMSLLADEPEPKYMFAGMNLQAIISKKNIPARAA